MHRRGERGQGLVELAVLLPILLVVVMGAVDLGRAYFAYLTIANAAHEGVFFASVRPAASDAEVQAVVDAETAGQLPGGVRVVDVTDLRTPGDQLTVTVQHDFAPLTGLFVNTPTFPVTARASMVVQ